jgi:hypothetical protein
LGAVNQDSLWREGMRPNAHTAMLPYQERKVHRVRAENPVPKTKHIGEWGACGAAGYREEVGCVLLGLVNGCVQRI